MLHKRSATGTGPVFIIEPPSKVDFVLKNTNVVINCLVHGDPDPNVTWYTKDGLQIHDQAKNPNGVFRILRNNSLMLQVMPGTSYQNGQVNTMIQASVFVCKASNRYGTIVSRPVQLNTGKIRLSVIVRTDQDSNPMLTVLMINHSSQ